MLLQSDAPAIVYFAARFVRLLFEGGYLFEGGVYSFGKETSTTAG